MENKKVLILSLGTGNKIETEYGFEEQRYKADFVAIPLIKIFDPDEIVIIGTVNSAWTELSETLIKEYFGEEVFKKLETEYEEVINYKPDKGCETKDDNKAIFEKRVSELFEAAYQNAGSIIVKRIHPICIKYGINDEELKSNYKYIQDKFKKIFAEKEIKYDVGFDITHSFRSLPIFNLVLLNYVRNTKDIEINISNIYYGCFEASRECGYAPIVDLNALMYSLDITTGVKEFLNTGSTISLEQAIENNEKKDGIRKSLTEKLSTIHNSFQFNRPDMLVKALNEIKDFTQDDNAEISGEVKEILKNTLETNFKNLFEKNNSDNLLYNPDVQLEIAEWFASRRSYGISAVCISEAIRGYATVLCGRYKKRKGHNEIKKDIENENIRRESTVDFFKKLSYLWWGKEKDIDKLPDSENSICKPFLNEYDLYYKMPEEINETDEKMIAMASLYNDVLQYVRNDFAHALWKSDETEDLSLYDKTKKIIDVIDYVKHMSELIKNEIKGVGDYYKKLYNVYNAATKKPDNEKVDTNSFYVIYSKQNYSVSNEKLKELEGKSKVIQPGYDKNDIPESQIGDQTKIAEARAEFLKRELNKISDYCKDNIIICININSLKEFDLMYICKKLRSEGYKNLSYFYTGSNNFKSIPNLDK